MLSSFVERAEALTSESLAVAYKGADPPRGINDFFRKRDKPGKLCCIFHYGRGGSFFASSFFDDHPQVLTAHPEAIMGGSYDRLVTTDFIDGFNCRLDGSANAIEVWCDQLLFFMPLFFREVRGQPEYDRYRARRPLFRNFLLAQLLLTERGNLSLETLMKMIMIAYRLSMGGSLDVDQTMAFIWQAHAPSHDRQRWIKSSFRDYVMLTVVRFPEKALDSELVHQILIEGARPLSAALRHSLFEHMAKYSELLYADPGRHFVVRFEDLHNNTAKTLQALCEMLGVRFYDGLCDTKFAMRVTDRTVAGRRDLTQDEFQCRLLNYYDRMKVRFLLQEEYRAWAYDGFCKNGLETSLKTYREDEIVQTLPFGAQALFAEFERDRYARFDSESERLVQISGLSETDIEMQKTKDLFRAERERRDRGIALIPPLFLPSELITSYAL